MITAVLSDIHANYKALEAVLLDIEKRGGADRFWRLGDIVDYGPCPHQCLEMIRQLKAFTIIGNHDYAVAGNQDAPSFAASIEVITRWTKTQLSPEERAYLKALPVTLSEGDFTLAHGSPRDPIWEYIVTREDAEENLGYFQTRRCLVGHTHVPLCFQFSEKLYPRVKAENKRAHYVVSQARWERLIREDRRAESTIQLNEDLFIINPGSVGQPRDHDPRAAYAVYNDSDATFEFRRVEYDIAATRRSMVEYGLPKWFYERLEEGL